MIYDLNNELQREAYKKRFVSLYNKRATVELTDKTNRTLNQNSYLHALIGFAAIEMGEPFEYVKQSWYKERSNKDLFVKEHFDKDSGEVIYFLISTAKLTKEEMSLSIDRFRNWLAIEKELKTPDPDNTKALNKLQTEIERNKQYLW